MKRRFVSPSAQRSDVPQHVVPGYRGELAKAGIAVAVSMPGVGFLIDPGEASRALDALRVGGQDRLWHTLNDCGAALRSPPPGPLPQRRRRPSQPR
ncbi:hypothetical protein [Streptomyces sp. NPDC005890]|uniref:hypothetical protein n=1 Tax=Streptomyces sp. NPDC005890 TaxID=3154568 RepID=UPI0033EF62CB